MRILLVFLCSIFGFSCLAQTNSAPADVVWGEELREPSGSYIEKLISYGTWGFYALRKKEASSFSKASAYIERYDSNSKLRKSKELNLKYKKKTRLFEDLILVGGELYLFTSFNNRSQKKNYLFAQKINRKRLIPEKKLTKIAEISTKSEHRAGQFDIEISKDSSKVLVYNQLPYQKREPERFAFRVYDNQFNSIWEKDITLPYNDEKFEVKEYSVDNQGNIYVLGIIYQDRNRRERAGRPTYQYTILSYTAQGEKFQEYKISLGDKFISELTFRIDRNGHLVCSGFYSEKNSYSVKGTYFFRLDPITEEVLNINSKEFDFEFRSALLSRSGKRRAEQAERQNNTRKEPELLNYALDDLILRSDGGALLIAEQFFVRQYAVRDFFDPRSRFGGSTLRYDYYYNYNDIIIVNIKPTGEIEWATRIPKIQETLNDGGYYSSYAKAIVRDKIYFVYNDNNRNFSKDSKRIYNFNGRNSVIAVTEVSIDGSTQKFPLFSNRDAGVITRPKICKQIGLRKMVIFGERGRTYRFGNLSFE
ncbi:MAG: hypothetical protein MK226_04315 [Saprospiraceae bacterium]|nr:hypothetical protein [Saprospiraceae bacterium]